ncbi:hypothetical protein M8J77_025394 [Diaphorina citri]|nr:hypothetical protein M8J77_025394 [Diaphorina citri]
MSSYCRITGKSRGLPKPNYFPILPPISAADAKRFCRITGKSYGLPTHHYLPVLLFSKNKKKKGKNAHETLGNKHRIVHGYRYVVPLIENSNVLMNLLESKTSDFLKINDLLHTNVTNITNKLVNKKKRKTKSKDLSSNGINDLFSIFKNDAISDIYRQNLKDFQGAKEKIFDEMVRTMRPGQVRQFLTQIEQQIQTALLSNREAEEILKKYDQNKLSKTKIDEKTIDLTKLPSQIDVNDIVNNIKDGKLVTIQGKEYLSVKTSNGEKLVLGQSITVHGRTKFIPGQTLVLNGVEKFVAGIVTNENGKAKLLAGQLVDLANKQKQFVRGQFVETMKGLEFMPSQISSGAQGVVSTPLGGPLLTAQTLQNVELQQVVNKMNPAQLQKTKVDTVLKDKAHELPESMEIQEIVQNMGEGKVVKVAGKEFLSVKTSKGEKLLVGQYANVNGKDVFVPGQTMTVNGVEKFVAGVVVNENGVSTLVPGQVVDLGNNQKQFVSGQFVETMKGLEFMPSQIGSGTVGSGAHGVVSTLGGPLLTAQTSQNVELQQVVSKMNPAQLKKTKVDTVLKDKAHELPESMEIQEIVQNMGEGKVVKVAGKEFLSVKTSKGEKLLVGQYVNVNGKNVFVPGQTMTVNGVEKFVAGVVVNENGVSTLVPGQVVDLGNNQKQFVSGQFVETMKGLEFMPSQIGSGTVGSGAHGVVSTLGGPLLTAQTSHNVELQQVVNKMNPAQLQKTKVDTVLKDKAHELPESMEIQEIVQNMGEGKVVKVAGKEFLSVKTSKGDKLLVGQYVNVNGKDVFVPGQTMTVNGVEKFVAGVVVNENGVSTLVPGQVVDLGNNQKQFVSGQFVETMKGLEFMPSQIGSGTVGSGAHGVVSTLGGPLLTAQASQNVELQQVVNKMNPAQLQKTKVDTVLKDKAHELPESMEIQEIVQNMGEGKVVKVAGKEFLSVKTSKGEKLLVGQYVNVNGKDVFVPGQTMTVNGVEKFVAGVVVNENGVSTLVPGQVVDLGNNQKQFVSGQFVETMKGLEFMPSQIGSGAHGVVSPLGGPLLTAQTSQNVELQQVVNKMNPAQLQKTKVDTVLKDKAHELPESMEIQEIVQNMGEGKVVKVAGKEFLSVKTSKGEKLLVGQYVNVNGKDVFVPGQTMTVNGVEKFVAGVVVNENGVSTLVPGQVVDLGNNQKQFVSGQFVETMKGLEFMPSQIGSGTVGSGAHGVVSTLGGPLLTAQTSQNVELQQVVNKMNPAQLQKTKVDTVLKDKAHELPESMEIQEIVQNMGEGKVVKVAGKEFLSVKTSKGDKLLVGQYVNVNGKDVFVPGQTMTVNGVEKFVAGVVVNENGVSTLVPGQVVDLGNNQKQFVSGQFVETMKGLEFMPSQIGSGTVGSGAHGVVSTLGGPLLTAQTSQNVELQQVVNKMNPAQLQKTKVDTVLKDKAHELPESMEIQEIVQNMGEGKVVKVAGKEFLSVKTSKGDKLLVGQYVNVNGKDVFVPGQTMTVNGVEKFVAGVVVNENGVSTLVPGQVVDLGNNQKQFVSGQFVETMKGLEFMPSQIGSGTVGSGAHGVVSTLGGPLLTAQTSQNVELQQVVNKMNPAQLQKTKVDTVLKDKAHELPESMEIQEIVQNMGEGKVVKVAGKEFLSVKTSKGEKLLVGQYVNVNGKDVFVPGQTMTVNGVEKFVAGVVVNENGVSTLVPGQVVDLGNNQKQFVSGQFVETMKGLEFMPSQIGSGTVGSGAHGVVSTLGGPLLTAQTSQNVELQQVVNKMNPAQLQKTKVDTVLKDKAHELPESMEIQELVQNMGEGKVVKVAGKEFLSVRTSKGDKLLVGQYVNVNGKDVFVPGQTMTVNGVEKFVAGVVVNENGVSTLVPGQVVDLGNNKKQFVSGQFVETMKGLEFMPSQIGSGTVGSGAHGVVSTLGGPLLTAQTSQNVELQQVVNKMNPAQLQKTKVDTVLKDKAHELPESMEIQEIVQNMGEGKVVKVAGKEFLSVKTSKGDKLLVGQYVNVNGKDVFVPGQTMTVNGVEKFVAGVVVNENGVSTLVPGQVVDLGNNKKQFVSGQFVETMKGLEFMPSQIGSGTVGSGAHGVVSTLGGPLLTAQTSQNVELQQVVNKMNPAQLQKTKVDTVLKDKAHELPESMEIQEIVQNMGEGKVVKVAGKEFLSVKTSKGEKLLVGQYVNVNGKDVFVPGQTMTVNGVEKFVAGVVVNENGVSTLVPGQVVDLGNNQKQFVSGQFVETMKGLEFMPSQIGSGTVGSGAHGVVSTLGGPLLTAQTSQNVELQQVVNKMNPAQLQKTKVDTVLKDKAHELPESMEIQELVQNMGEGKVVKVAGKEFLSVRTSKGDKLLVGQYVNVNGKDVFVPGQTMTVNGVEKFVAGVVVNENGVSTLVPGQVVDLGNNKKQFVSGQFVETMKGLEFMPSQIGSGTVGSGAHGVVSTLGGPLLTAQTSQNVELQQVVNKMNPAQLQKTKVDTVLKDKAHELPESMEIQEIVQNMGEGKVVKVAGKEFLSVKTSKGDKLLVGQYVNVNGKDVFVPGQTMTVNGVEKFVAGVVVNENGVSTLVPGQVVDLGNNKKQFVSGQFVETMKGLEFMPSQIGSGTVGSGAHGVVSTLGGPLLTAQTSQNVELQQVVNKMNPAQLQKTKVDTVLKDKAHELPESMEIQEIVQNMGEGKVVKVAGKEFLSVKTSKGEKLLVGQYVNVNGKDVFVPGQTMTVNGVEKFVAGVVVNENGVSTLVPGQVVDLGNNQKQFVSGQFVETMKGLEFMPSQIGSGTVGSGAHGVVSTLGGPLLTAQTSQNVELQQVVNKMNPAQLQKTKVDTVLKDKAHELPESMEIQEIVQNMGEGKVVKVAGKEFLSVKTSKGDKLLVGQYVNVNGKDVFVPGQTMTVNGVEKFVAGVVVNENGVSTLVPGQVVDLGNNQKQFVSGQFVETMKGLEFMPSQIGSGTVGSGAHGVVSTLGGPLLTAQTSQNVELQQVVNKMNPAQLQKTKVDTVLKDKAHELPESMEIQEIVQNMGEGKVVKVAGKEFLSVKTSKGDKLLVGQYVNVNGKDVFVPGQTMTVNGVEKFVAGVVVNENGVSTLVPGQVVDLGNNQKQFVSGQFVETMKGLEFMPSQIGSGAVGSGAHGVVSTLGGPLLTAQTSQNVELQQVVNKMNPAQLQKTKVDTVLKDKAHELPESMEIQEIVQNMGEGKVVKVAGKEFLSVKTSKGDKLLVGQYVNVNGKDVFVPGQTMTVNGVEKFVAGVVVNENGVSTLVPGQVVDLGNNQKQFVSGQFVETMKGLEFMPSQIGSGTVGSGAHGVVSTLGEPLLTAQTSQNVELQQVVNKMNPAQLQKTKVDTVLKDKAHELPESMEIQEIVQNMGEGKVVKVAGKEFLSVKTSKGDKLLVGQYVNVNGKDVFVPGQTMTVNGVEKFVAGVVVNENGVSTLVPGQVVDLGNNQKQFVSGQFVETMKGLEFMPSQIGSGTVGSGAHGVVSTLGGPLLTAQTSQNVELQQVVNKMNPAQLQKTKVDTVLKDKAHELPESMEIQEIVQNMGEGKVVKVAGKEFLSVKTSKGDKLLVGQYVNVNGKDVFVPGQTMTVNGVEKFVAGVVVNENGVSTLVPGQVVDLGNNQKQFVSGQFVETMKGLEFMPSQIGSGTVGSGAHGVVSTLGGPLLTAQTSQNVELQQVVNKMNPAQLQKTKVDTVLKDKAHELPESMEIQEIVQNMGEGKVVKVAGKEFLSVKTSKGDKLLVGQYVNVNGKDVFVPGQTMTVNGVEKFVAGVVVNENGVSTLVPGQVVDLGNNQKQFVSGQFVETMKGLEFMPSQIGSGTVGSGAHGVVSTLGGPLLTAQTSQNVELQQVVNKMNPAQLQKTKVDTVLKDKAHELPESMEIQEIVQNMGEGKVVKVAGKEFLSVKTSKGDKLLVGQYVNVNGKDVFVPGQTMTVNGVEKFVAGVVVNENGVSTLVPGQVVDLGNNQKQFVSGQFVETMKGLEFMPSQIGSGTVGSGAHGVVSTLGGPLLTAQTSQNVELQQVVNKMNPAQLQKTKVDTVLKDKAHELPESMEIQEIVQNMGEGKVVKVAGKEFLSVKTSKGDKLLVGQYVNVNGKDVFVPGQTMTVNGVEKFVAGVVVNENGVSTLVPGQVVDLGNNQKQFVSGQFVETMKGLEFMPSQIGSGTVGSGAHGVVSTLGGPLLTAQTSQNVELQQVVNKMNPAQLQKTKVDTVLKDKAHELPESMEIQEIVQNMGEGKVVKVAGKEFLSVKTSKGDKLLVGQYVNVNGKDVFVPGQTMTVNGVEKFVAGVVVNENGVSTLVPGQVVDLGNNQKQFVSGQFVETMKGLEFMPSQIGSGTVGSGAHGVVSTLGGPLLTAQTSQNVELQQVVNKMNPAQLQKTKVDTVLKDKAHELPESMEIQEIVQNMGEGKVVKVAGKEFLSVKTSKGEKLLVGQYVNVNGKDVFVPGQTMTVNGVEKFVAGVVVNENGVSTLVPGQVVDLGNNQKQFVSGQFVETMKGLEFMPSQIGSGTVGSGAHGVVSTLGGPLLTAQTSQNVELQQVVNKMNPAQLQKTKVDTVLKDKAHELPESMEIQEIFQNMGEGKVVKVAGKEFLSVKTSKGDKLLVGQYVNVNGKDVFVPGQTMTVNGVEKFVAGVVVNENGVSTLVPGQVVDLGNNQKQFVSGQFVETMKGLEFMPSQIGSGTVGSGAHGVVSTLGGPLLTAQTSQNVELQQVVNKMNPAQLQKTKVDTVLKDKAHELPESMEIQEIVQNMGEGKVVKVAGKEFLSVKTSKGDKLLVGQYVNVNGKDVFVPGQTMTVNGVEKFVAGVVVNENGVSTLVPGQVVDLGNNQKQFVSGQFVETMKGLEFMPSQIGSGTVGSGAHGVVSTLGGPLLTAQTSQNVELQQVVNKMNPAQLQKTKVDTVLKDKAHELPESMEIQEIVQNMREGKVVNVAGKEFLSVKTSKGDKLLVGQYVNVNGKDVFVPGQTMTVNGVEKFVAGVVVNENGVSTLVPGQVVDLGINKKAFCEGEFVETIDGPQFFPSTANKPDIEKVLQELENGTIMNVCGKDVLCVRTDSGEHYLVGQHMKIDGKALFVPGQTLVVLGTETFVPGIITNENGVPKLIPGQIVTENNNKQFVIGQFIKTDQGIDFIESVKNANGVELVRHHVKDVTSGSGKDNHISDQVSKFENIEENDTFDENSEEPLFIYKVNERKCSLVFPAKLEAAVRDGDIANVMLSKNDDTILFKMKYGNDITVDIKDVPIKQIQKVQLYDGEGISKEKKNKLADITKKFENNDETKEKAEDDSVKEEVVENWNSVNVNDQNDSYFDSKVATTGKAAKSEKLITLDFEKFQHGLMKNVSYKLIVSEMPEPMAALNSTKLNLTQSIPGIIQQPAYKEIIANIKVKPILKPFKPLHVVISNELIETLHELTSSQLELTNIEGIFNKSNMHLLPNICDLVDIAKNIKNGKVVKVQNKEFLSIPTSNGEKLVIGQNVVVNGEKMFIPGQTMHDEHGDYFLSGIVINDNEEARILPGHIAEVDDENMFVLGMITNTRIGVEFVQGQFIKMNNENKFFTGQTVLTNDGIMFVPGQTDTINGIEKFVPGEIILTPSGLEFVEGQIFEKNGEYKFVAGKSILNNHGIYEFIPGKTIKINDQMKFVPGEVMETDVSKEFIPGRYVMTDNMNEVTFLPGITNESNEFVPGMFVNTPDGKKFVKGQIVLNEYNEKVFLPGETKVVNDEIVFDKYSDMSDLESFSDFENDYNNVMDNLSDNEDTSSIHELFGHMIQTETSIEFYPGENTNGLPNGKLIPGKILRNKKDIQFVPGTLINNKFIPGQMIDTEDGEKFIPGQIINTKSGPKFVPGQIIENSEGSKFIPGQIIEVEENGEIIPKFVPGQILDTRNGPVFIPGQIIETVENGNLVNKFIPGQVVETKEGPKFVPGRVIEVGEKITFVPGQIVETSEGLKFVAPDLADDNISGTLEYTIQGFEISSDLLDHNYDHITNIKIDNNVLKQLNKAGMSFGYEIQADVPLVDIDSTNPCIDIAHQIVKKLKLENTDAIKLSQILITISNIVKCDIKLINNNSSEMNIISDLVNELKCMNGVIKMEENDENLYKNIYELVENKLQDGKVINFIEKLHNFIISKPELFRKPNKLKMINEVLELESNEQIVNELIQILEIDDENENICSAFKNIIKNDENLKNDIIENLKENIKGCTTELQANEIIQKTIINTVRQVSANDVKALLSQPESTELKDLILQAIGLARALGIRETASTLLSVINQPHKLHVLNRDEVTLDILKRLVVMKKLAVNKNIINSINQLQLNPDLCKNDSILCELVRESASLMVVPEEITMYRSSNDIPASILFSDNTLASENFLSKTNMKNRNILVIVKHGCQAIFPKEASRLVLSGQVSYTLLDEKGVFYFKPMHVFSALKLPTLITNRKYNRYFPDGNSADNKYSIGIGFNGVSNALKSSYHTIRVDTGNKVK